MLYPISNKYRSILNLNGIWKFKCVDDNYLPINPLKDYKLMAVPSSINDIVVDRKSIFFTISSDRSQRMLN